jgi:hypothetical protein
MGGGEDERASSRKSVALSLRTVDVTSHHCILIREALGNIAQEV